MDLRALLFDAVASDDPERLEQLCREHREAIVAVFGSWQLIPEAMRGDTEALQHYAQGLLAIARVFADQLGDAQLLRQLTGGDEDPLARWQAELDEAAADIAQLRFSEAGRRLERLLETTRGLRGSAADQLRPVTLSYIAECLFQQGNADAAIPFMREALALARAAGDVDGIAASLEALYEMHRYLGRGVDAAIHAAELATVFAMAGRETDAHRLQRRAALARAGEPRNRVVATLDDGTVLELDEVPRHEGRLRFSFQRDRVTLRKAEHLVEQGEAAGAEGRYAEALALFEAAAEADPQFPHACYEQGFTLLLLRRYDDAVAALARTEELAPGWFHCRADLWLARELAAGRLDHDAFEALRALESGPQAPEAKLALADRTIARAPQLAALHLERGRQLAALGRPVAALAAIRDGLARDPEPDVRTRLLVQLAAMTTDEDEATRLFEEAVALGGNLVAAATARLALRRA